MPTRLSFENDHILDGIAAIAMLFFASLSLSYAFPLTAVVIFLFATYYLLKKRQDLHSVVGYFRNLGFATQVPLVLYFVVLVSFFAHAMSFYSSDSLVRSTTFRAVAFNVYAFIFFVEINKSNIDKFFYKFSRFTAISISLISLFSLIRLYLCFMGIVIETDVVISEWQLFLSSLVADNNYYSLGILSGIFSVIYLWTKGHKFSKICFLIMLVALYFAASRRAVFIATALMAYFLVASCLSPDKRFNFLKFGKLVGIFIFLFAGWMIVPGILQKNFSEGSKRNFVEAFGLDYTFISNYLPLARFRYLTVIDENTSLDALTNEFYKGKDSFFYIAPGFLSLDKLLSGDSFEPSRDKSKLSFEDLSYEFRGALAPTDGGRVVRWLYAWEEFKTYSFKEKILGAGGKYHFSYSEKFPEPHGNIVLDYPHNPFLSLLLYSGILVAMAFLIVYLYGLSLFLVPNVITLGLFPTAHFFNSVSLDLVWANYHFPFMIIFALKMFEIAGSKLRSAAH